MSWQIALVLLVLLAVAKPKSVQRRVWAAGAIVEMMGGSPRQVGHAIALCMKNLLGLACDPVAGLVEVPCVKRNGFYAVHAITASEMALMILKSNSTR